MKQKMKIFGATLMLLLSNQLLMAQGDLDSTVESFMTTTSGIILMIVTALAIITISWGSIKIMTTGDDDRQNDVIQNTKKIMSRVLIGLAMFAVAVPFVEYVTENIK